MVHQALKTSEARKFCNFVIFTCDTAVWRVHDVIGWEPVNVREFERHAQLMLSKNAFDYYASGANDMVTLRENRWGRYL